jgi:hypothetical protein
MKRVTLYLLSMAAVLAQPPDQIHLAWVESPSTTLTVLWRTVDIDVPSIVEYRPSGTQKWLAATGGVRPSGTRGILHEVTLRGLKPSTGYDYRVKGPQNTWSDVQTTRTAPTRGPAKFDVAFLADTGMVGRKDGLTTGTTQVIREVARLDTLLVLLGGDYAYYNTDQRFGTLDNTIDEWFNQVKSIATRSVMMPTYGNHEIFLKEGYLFWADRFPTPEGFDNRRFYSFDIGDIHFVSILAADSERGAIPTTAVRWIENDMAMARKAGARWIVPFLHVAPFSDGSNHPSNLDIRAQLGPVFEKFDVKIALTCHDQSYERTFPLRGVPHDIKLTSQARDCYGDKDGVTWLKVGPGGKMSNINGKFADFKTNPPPFYTAFRDNTAHHFARLRVAPDVIRMEIFAVKADGHPAAIQDTFEYNLKGCAAH